MGYGGYLIYSGLIRNAQKAFPDKKIVVVYPTSLKNIIKRKISDAEIILKNNPRIHAKYDKFTWKLARFFYISKQYLILDLEDERFQHHYGSTPEKVDYKTGAHAIEFACQPLGIKNIELQPEIYLDEHEVNKASNILSKNNLLGAKYICIESGSKTEFTPNKAWFEDYWFELIRSLTNHFKENAIDLKIVQIGTLSTPALENTIYLNGQLTFRETAHILKDSLFFVSYIGGLTHLARAVHTQNVVLKSAWEPKELTYYPGDVDFYTEIECKHCGLLKLCPINKKCMREIKPNDVFFKCIEIINSKKL